MNMKEHFDRNQGSESLVYFPPVWQEQILDRLPSNDESLRWKVTAQKVTVKIMDFQKIMEQDSHLAERPQNYGGMSSKCI